MKSLLVFPFVPMCSQPTKVNVMLNSNVWLCLASAMHSLLQEASPHSRIPMLFHSSLTAWFFPSLTCFYTNKPLLISVGVLLIFSSINTTSPSIPKENTDFKWTSVINTDASNILLGKLGKYKSGLFSVSDLAGVLEKMSQVQNSASLFYSPLYRTSTNCPGITYCHTLFLGCGYS